MFGTGFLRLDSDTESTLRRGLKSAVDFALEYRWLVNAFVLDFYTEDHWSTLPSEWSQFLDSVQIGELTAAVAHFVLGSDEASCSPVGVPESLKSFLSTCKRLSLPRNPVSSLDGVVKEGSEVFLGSDGETRGGGQVMNLEHVFRRHVKPKKQHEIRRMAAVVAAVAESSGSTIVDLGSGQGHLARVLAFGYSLDVVALEEQEVFASRARDFDAEILRGLKRNPGEIKTPQHVALKINPEVPRISLIQRFEQSGVKSDRLTITGLHTCGDLGPTIVRMFAELEQVKAICSVACCYMKLSCLEESEAAGFPLSAELRRVDEQFRSRSGTGEDAFVSYEARELACHALESYVTGRLAVPTECDKLKIHGYRALLEKLLVARFPHLRRVGLRGVKNAHLMSFPAYVREALKKLPEMSPEIVEEMIADEASWAAEASSGWKRVLMFYLLRLCAAPVIETVLLLDRMFFLYEKGYGSCLVPIFDPTLSARNHALIAVK